MGAGSFFGAASAYHASASKPGTTVSAMVGTLASGAKRFFVVTASSFILPLSTCGVMPATEEKMIGISPDSSASTGALPPL